LKLDNHNQSVSLSAFRSLLGRSLEQLCDQRLGRFVARNLRWGEGPAWSVSDSQWIFSDIPNNRLLRWSSLGELCTYREPSQFANGNFVCGNGDLLTCEHGTRRVIRTSSQGAVSVLCDRYRGAKLNSPNDVVEKSDGTVWFTDPTYGILSDIEGRKAPSEQPRCCVYRFDPRTGDVSRQVSELCMPNGLCFSPGEDVLFVADSGADQGPDVPFDPKGPRDVFAFPLEEGQVAGPARRVRRVSVGVPDGIRCDADGYLWIACGNGIECVAPDGVLQGSIAAAEVVSNLAFGGHSHEQLFLTLATSAFLVDLKGLANHSREE
jgi:gluconolactonase